MEEAGDQQLDTVVEIKDALDETSGRLLQADGPMAGPACIISKTLRNQSLDSNTYV